jgi:hypothetical protein
MEVTGTMQRIKQSSIFVLAAMVMVALVVTACGGAAPTPVPPTAIPATVAPTKAPLPATAVPAATAAPTKAPALTPAAPAGQFSDPFSYCAAIGTLDAPDARFTGPRTPESILNGLRTALNMPSTTVNEQFERSTFWRCMGGKVYACNVGANIPCSAKAVTDKTPTQGMKDFCTANPKSDFLPAAVTGRETVYSWKCTDGVPVVDKELTKPDAAGFLSMFWYEIASK